MGTCFVIQPFDGGPFDKRYDDIISPGIGDAGLEPYRVDRDPTVVVPIDEIERRIGSSAACVAEISTDNPNVWFELGIAIAKGIPVVLLCGEERPTPFPFDIQHRAIILYKKESSSDFARLREQIAEKITAILKKHASIERAVSLSSGVTGAELSQHETVALVTIAQNLESPDDSVDISVIQRDMEGFGFTRLATFVAMTSLLNRGFVNVNTFQDEYARHTHYGLEKSAIDWLVNNQSMLVLRAVKSEPRIAVHNDDDLPF